MKTSIELSDELVREAYLQAAKHQITVNALIELGLDLVLNDLRQPNAYKMKDASVRGFGLQPGQENLTWPEIRAMIYEGHGG